jgi:hypothetical protein
MEVSSRFDSSLNLGNSADGFTLPVVRAKWSRLRMKRVKSSLGCSFSGSGGSLMELIERLDDKNRNTFFKRFHAMTLAPLP